MSKLGDAADAGGGGQILSNCHPYHLPNNPHRSETYQSIDTTISPYENLWFEGGQIFLEIIV